MLKRSWLFAIRVLRWLERCMRACKTVFVLMSPVRRRLCSDMCDYTVVNGDTWGSVANSKSFYGKSLLRPWAESDPT